MKLRWTTLNGPFEIKPNKPIIFQGGTVDWVDGNNVTQTDGATVGTTLCDAPFSDGIITATIKFRSVEITPHACGLIIRSNPANGAHLSVLLGGIHIDDPLVGIRGWDGTKWESYKDLSAGSGTTLKSNHPYELKVTLSGSQIRIELDGVLLINGTLPFVAPITPIGLWCFSKSHIEIANYKAQSIAAKAFVVMQFTAPYNELYTQVIKTVCKEFSIDSFRADEQFGPGVIISDIAKQIESSKVVIAEITPTNPNVYYEVGYAHALKKPTILIAERGTQLPFDVSPFRVLLYENSIDGKAKIEEGLRHHLKAILS